MFGQDLRRAGCAQSPLPASRAACTKPALRRTFDLGARDAGVERQVDDRGGEDDVGHRVAERGDDAHREHEQREGHDRVGDAADDAVGPAAEDSRRRRRRAPPSDERRSDRRDTAMPRSSRVATITREKMSRPSWSVPNQCCARRRLQRRRGVAGERIVGHERRPEQRGSDEQQRTARRRRRVTGFSRARSAHGAACRARSRRRRRRGDTARSMLASLIAQPSSRRAGRSRRRACR